MAIDLVDGTRNALLLWRDSLEYLSTLGRRFPVGGTYFFGPYQSNFATGPELVQKVLVDHADDFHKFPMMEYLRPLIGNGLLLNEDAPWRRQRKLVAPSLQPRRVAGYATMMVDYARQTVEGWQDGAEIDLAVSMMALTLRIVGKTLFDTELSGHAGAIADALEVSLAFVNQRGKSLFPVPLTWPLPGNRRYRRAVAAVDGVVRAMIAERRASGVDHGDLLSALLAARDEDGQPMDDTQLRDECMTLVLAGHETTANALMWTLSLLWRHPEDRARVEREVDGALAGRAPTLDDLPRLPYTLQVLKESLRLYPPAYVMGRMALRDLDLGEIKPRKGQFVIISPYAMHRNPAVFADPERFDPERFAPEAEKRLPRGAYLPFGGGPRICVGNHFALMEAHLILAVIAQRARLDLVAGALPVPEPTVTLRPRGSVRARVSARAPAGG